MPFPWFVALRYMRDARGQTALILAAVAVGVSVIVFLSALINGLQASLIANTLGSQPHITVRPAREAARPLVGDTSDRVVARAIGDIAGRCVRDPTMAWPAARPRPGPVPRDRSRATRAG